MQNSERIVGLIRKYLDDDVTIEERDELNQWVAENDFNRQVFQELTEQNSIGKELAPLAEADFDMIWNKMVNRTKIVSIRSKRKNHWKYLAAACVLICILIGGYFWLNPNKQKDMPETIANTNNNDVQPGTEKAILTLADGTKITLDNTTNGTIAQQGNTVILKDDGLLAYNSDQAKSQKEILYNTLTTTRGEEFRSLVLSDGTKIWLNSVSSIRFPTSFIGDERNVEITGEAYFEVAKNPSKPFKVKVNGMEVEVLGTHFNVSAYSDEAAITTTLLEGSVRVKKGIQQLVIKPGQQTQLINQDQLKLVENADIDAAMAWKNGSFYFQDDDIEAIMRKLSRWYDAEIVYEGKITKKYTGIISRNVKVSEIFRFLEMSGGVEARIEAGKIILRSNEKTPKQF